MMSPIPVVLRHLPPVTHRDIEVKSRTVTVALPQRATLYQHEKVINLLDVLGEETFQDFFNSEIGEPVDGWRTYSSLSKQIEDMVCMELELDLETLGWNGIEVSDLENRIAGCINEFEERLEYKGLWQLSHSVAGLPNPAFSAPQLNLSVTQSPGNPVLLSNGKSLKILGL